jgi:hypothetical protein
LHIRKRLAGIGALAIMASTACGWPGGFAAWNPSMSLSPAGSFAGMTAPVAPHSLQVSPVIVTDDSMAWTDGTGTPDGSMLAFADESTGARADVVDAWTAALATSEPQTIAFDSFRLAVPFRTQKDGSRFQGSNCGPAALGMVLQAFGITESNDELRFQAHTYQDTIGRRGGTALQHMATVSYDYGLVPAGLYADGGASEDFAAWTIEDVRTQLRAGRPVIPLVKYRLLPGYEGSTVRFDHYVVVFGMQGDGFRYHDPAQGSAEDGAARWISAEQLDRAMSSASISRQAVSFDRRAFAPLAVARLRS